MCIRDRDYLSNAGSLQDICKKYKIRSNTQLRKWIKAVSYTHLKRPRDYSVKEMLKTNQYWLMFAVVGLATPAVLLFSPIIVELAQMCIRDSTETRPWMPPTRS